MSEGLIDRIAARIGFCEEDAQRVRALGDDLRSAIPELVERFYVRLFEHPGARAVFTGGEAQMARQRVAFGRWLEEVFEARFDEERLQSRLRIGDTHVRVGLPQEYMLIGIELVWQEVEAAARRRSLADTDARLQSLHKLLTIEMTLMLETYKESYSQLVQRGERDAVQERLSRAESLAEIGQLAASLAHEIKNPLAGISGAIEIIGDGMPRDSPHRPIVREMLGQIQRLNATVRDLLTFARPAAPAALRINLNKIVRRVLTVLQAEPALKGLEVKAEMASEFVPVQADEGQLEQVVMNLVINAAQSCSEGGKIRVLTQLSESAARLIVTDTGHGMTPEVQRRAFDPFFTTKTKGTGLGLAICRKIVEAQGGTISLASTVGEGTTVTVEFQRAAQPSTEAEGP